MQQNINPENDDYVQEIQFPRNIKILKPKGKPFWLNLSPSRKTDYHKFKTQQGSEKAYQEQLSSKLKTEVSDVKQLQIQEKQYLESIQDDNQNYQDDFQTYNETMNNSKKLQKSKIPLLDLKKTQKPKIISRSFNRSQLSLPQSPLKKINISSLRSQISQRMLKRSATDKSTSKKINEIKKPQEPFNITKFMLFNENTMYLRSQNEKLIRKIQYLRQMLPILIRNDQVIFQQRTELYQLKNKINKATSAQYEFKIEQKKLNIETSQKSLIQKIKKLNSPKHQQKVQSILNDQFQFLPNHQQTVRQQLMHKLRLFCLKEQKSISLDKKVALYEQFIQRLDQKSKILSFHNLERRKIFLEWDLKRMKNQFDIKILQEKVMISQHEEQLKRVNVLIEQADSMLSKKQESFKFNSKPKNKSFLMTNIRNDAIQQIQINQQIQQNQNNKCSNSKQKQSIYRVSNKKDILFSPKIQNERYSEPILQINDSQQNVQKQVKNTIKHESLRQKKMLNKSNANINIRIKKSSFKNASLVQDLEQVVL